VISHSPIRWDADARDQLRTVSRRFRDEVGSEPWAVAWCAGAGVIGTSTDELNRETQLLETILDELSSFSGPGTLFLSSSAGGAFGGASELPITEHSPTAAISDYGRNKLVQEALVESWATTVGGRAVIGRISNLYGPGQELSKPQGLISQLCLATLTRHPLSIYVSLDTIRDYLFVTDCSQVVVDCLRRGADLAAGEHRMKIIASSRCMSIGGVVAEIHRVLGRSPTVVMVPSDRSGSQGSALSFRSDVWRDLDCHQLTTLPSGIDQTAGHLRTLLNAGGLASTADR
jgi:UDP-glucose 4-epimerase